MLIATLALTIPHTGFAAQAAGRAAGAAGGALQDGRRVAVPARRSAGVSQGQRNRAPVVQRSQRGRAGKAPKGRKNDRRDYRVYVPRRPRQPAVVYPRRAPVRYSGPYYDVQRTYLGRTGFSLSFLYSAGWGDVYVEFGRPVPETVYVVPAPILAPAPVSLRRSGSIHIPPGYLPPRGLCRVWYPGTPPGHQPPPTDCDSAYWYAPAGSYIVYGG
ncbi:MAG: hypothetical protein PVJ51_03710 [Acidobacteriota bacterium]|jgi:hypothetical protein